MTATCLKEQQFLESSCSEVRKHVFSSFGGLGCGPTQGTMRSWLLELIPIGANISAKPSLLAAKGVTEALLRAALEVRENRTLRIETLERNFKRGLEIPGATEQEGLWGTSQQTLSTLLTAWAAPGTRDVTWRWGL